MNNSIVISYFKANLEITIFYNTITVSILILIFLSKTMLINNKFEIY